MQEPQPMFPHFHPVSKKDWLAKLKEDLKDKSYNELQWHTYEGFNVEPYYTRSEVSQLDYLQQLHNTLVTSTSTQGSAREWVNNQYIRVKNEKNANAVALEALNNGAEGLYFDVSKLQDIKLGILLKDIKLNYCSVSFLAGSQADQLLSAYIRYAKEQGVQAEELNGIFNFDPIGEIAESGLIDSDHFSSFASVTSKTGRMPHFYGITINTDSFHDSGASAVQEIAFGLNLAVSNLDHLTDGGMSAADAIDNLCFSVSIGTSYFMEIAKLRAIRWLFAKIANSYGLTDYQPGQLYIHARPDTWSASILDPHVNMLRYTTQAMSAIIGGCNALSIPPFDSSFAEPSAFSRRISRNISSILKEEAYFDKVADAAAGSYYIETLTDRLITASWALFLQVEEKGGFSRAFEKGFIQEELRRVRKDKLQDINTRKQKLVGVNAYANAEEKLPKSSTSTGSADQEKLLSPQRRGAAYENLRVRTEAYIAAGHERPLAILLQFGDAAMGRARSAFASDFLRCAGFATQEAHAQPQSSQLNQLLQQRPSIIVCCSSDADYEAQVPELADYVRKFFNGLLLVAGRPDSMKEVKHAAIDGFIHLKSDALDVLTEIQDKLFGEE
ncbi:methylmalonyl-CoA mutase subunit beta [Nafulsella turpanensis]|uniref:methylmalonyl-CoA mutase subunit beta n=1 Tax=Nafulsella turpanensis TaxID=1265690 RepID=UPI00035FDA27|nr:methylmalonyl-CoA mutase subunit beta [Nafulsella turpanensis]